MSLGDLGERAPLERGPTREQLIHEQAHEIDVGADVEGLAAGGLRSQVFCLREAAQIALARSADLCRPRSSRLKVERVSNARAGQRSPLAPERIADEEDVGGLDVEVQDVGLMKCLHGGEHLGDDALTRFGVEGLWVAHALAEVAPIEERLDREEEPLGTDADVQGGHEVGVAKRGRTFGVVEQLICGG